MEILDSFERFLDVLRSYADQHLLYICSEWEKGFYLFTRADNKELNVLYIAYKDIDVFEIKKDHLFLLLRNGTRILLANNNDCCQTILSNKI